MLTTLLTFSYQCDADLVFIATKVCELNHCSHTAPTKIVLLLNQQVHLRTSLPISEETRKEKYGRGYDLVHAVLTDPLTTASPWFYQIYLWYSTHRASGETAENFIIWIFLRLRL